MTIKEIIEELQRKVDKIDRVIAALEKENNNG
jgi:hypothetical protein